MLEPIEDRIVVRPEANDGFTPGGLAIPDNAERPRTRRGTVIAAGPGKWCDKTGRRRKMQIIVGDDVIIESKATINVDGEELWVTSEEQALVIVREEAAIPSSGPNQTGAQYF